MITISVIQRADLGTNTLMNGMDTVMEVTDGGQVAPGHGKEILWFVHGRPRFDSLLLKLYDSGVYVFPAFIKGFLNAPLAANAGAGMAVPSRSISNDQVSISDHGTVLSLTYAGHEWVVEYLSWARSVEQLYRGAVPRHRQPRGPPPRTTGRRLAVPLPGVDVQPSDVGHGSRPGGAGHSSPRPWPFGQPYTGGSCPAASKSPKEAGPSSSGGRKRSSPGGSRRRTKPPRAACRHPPTADSSRPTSCSCVCETQASPSCLGVSRPSPAIPPRGTGVWA